MLQMTAKSLPGSQSIAADSSNSSAMVAAAANEAANGCLHGQQQQQPQLCCVMVPLLAMGHIIPMMDLGLLLAEQGVSVTLFTTAANADRLSLAVTKANAASLPISVTALPYHVEGIPDGMENADQTSSATELFTLMAALGQLEAPFRDHLIKRFDPSRTFMVSDFCVAWTRDVSRNLNIPRYVFYAIPCFAVCCDQVIRRLYDSGGAPKDEFEPFVLSGIPHSVEVTRAQAPGMFLDLAWRRKVEAAMETADGIIVNTFAALEPEYLELVEKDMGKPVWPVGPVALYNSGDSEIAAVRGISTPSAGVAKIVNWLDTQKPRSVVYVCLGSQAQTTVLQAAEIGLGLEASWHPFLWVLRARSSQSKEMEDWLAGGFEDRTKDRGLVVRGWAPQQLILHHAAISGFVTHCGWNSSSEALSSGVPVATWPFFFDQFINEKLLVDVLGVGVAVGVKAQQYWWDDELTVRRGRMEEVVRELMGDGEEAERRRTRVREIGVAARKAMQVGEGESRRTLAALIQDAARRAGERRAEV